MHISKHILLTFKHIIVSMRGTKVTIAGLMLTYNTTNKLSYRAEKCHWHIFWQLRGNGRQYKTIQKMAIDIDSYPV